jgi:hypothetical protein
MTNKPKLTAAAMLEQMIQDWRAIGEARLADQLAAIVNASHGLDRSTRTICVKPVEPKGGATEHLKS